MGMNRKEHWEKVYKTKELSEVGWFQEKPVTSLKFIEKINPPRDAKIIDVGGGAFFLVDYLLEMSFTDLTVLDISKTSLEKAKQRLLEKRYLVKWIEQDVVNFQPTESFDIWHDRAAFHFLTNESDIRKYVQLISDSVVKNGHFIIGTFSVDGPKKCSSLDIVQYSEESMLKTFGDSFALDESLWVDHIAPSGSKQNYLFCHFIRK
jgi:SAM-dependent methyltransferase